MPTFRPSLAQNRVCVRWFIPALEYCKERQESILQDMYGMIQMCREAFDLAASGVRWWIAMSCCLIFYRKFRGCKHTHITWGYELIRVHVYCWGSQATVGQGHGWINGDGVNMHIRSCIIYLFFTPTIVITVPRAIGTQLKWKGVFSVHFPNEPATIELHMWMDITLFLVGLTIGLIFWSNGSLLPWLMLPSHMQGFLLVIHEKLDICSFVFD